MEKTRLEKFGFPPRAAISGVIRSLISAWTTLLNATPTTTATERSTRLLRTRNFLKPAIHPTISCAGRGGRKVPPTRRDQDVTIPAPGPPPLALWPARRPSEPGAAIPRAVRWWPANAGLVFLEHATYAAGKCQRTSLL